MDVAKQHKMKELNPEFFPSGILKKVLETWQTSGEGFKTSLSTLDPENHYQN